MSLRGESGIRGRVMWPKIPALIALSSVAASLACARSGDEAAATQVRSEKFRALQSQRAGRRSGHAASPCRGCGTRRGRCSLVADDLDTLRAPPTGYRDRRGRGRHGPALGRVARHRVAGGRTRARRGPADCADRGCRVASRRVASHRGDLRWRDCATLPGRSGVRRTRGEDIASRGANRHRPHCARRRGRRAPLRGVARRARSRALRSRCAGGAFTRRCAPGFLARDLRPGGRRLAAARACLARPAGAAGPLDAAT